MHGLKPIVKKCKHCNKKEAFYFRSVEKGTVGDRCKKCHHKYLRTYTKDNARKHRNSQVRYRHKVEFEVEWVKQGGMCAMCGTSMLPIGSKKTSAVVDHDHACCDSKKSCGKCFRGLIHSSCNKLLGAASDDLNVLSKAIEYLTQRKIVE